MSEGAPSPEPSERLEGRDLFITVMGKAAFDIESGPNAHTPETDEFNPELADDLPSQPEDTV